MSTKSHDMLVIDGMVGIGSLEDIGGTSVTGINSGPNVFMIGVL